MNELELLRQKLQETQDALRAIQHGEVDALVVPREGGPTIFTLQGAEQSYRHFVEAMNEGAVTVAQDGTIFYSNGAFAKLLGLPLESFTGYPIDAFIVEGDRKTVRTLIQNAAQASSKIAVSLQRSDARRIPVQISASALPQNPVPIFCLVVTDLTDRHRAETALEEARQQLEIKVEERTMELNQRQQELEASEATLRSFYDSAPVLMGIVEVTERQFLHVYDNPASCAFLGVAPESTRGKSSAELGVPLDMVSAWRKHYERSLLLKTPVHFEYFTHNAGKEHWLGVTVAPIRGKSHRLSYVATDITEQKLSEFALKISEDRLTDVNKTLEKRVSERTHALEEANTAVRASLQEKDVLLKEVHHRVKNNLQIISSLLRLQLSRLQDSHSSDILQESQNRIRSMAMIHEQLYRTRDMSNINFKDYLQTLMVHLSQSYSDLHQGITFELDVDPIQLDLDTAIPCALIATELISNAFKHAFTGLPAGRIKIGFKRTLTDHVALSVEDNGSGMPADYDFKQSESLGFTILNALCRQLRGTLDVRPSAAGGGTCFTMDFAIAALPKPVPIS